MKYRNFISGICFLIVFLIAGQSNAQVSRVMNLPNYDEAKYHFGFILAINQMFFTINPYGSAHNRVFDSTYTPDLFADSSQLYVVESNPNFGFTVGIVGNLRLGKYFDLRFVPSLAFGERYLDYDILQYKDGEETLLEVRKNIASTNIELPLHVKYKSKRLQNSRAYLLLGGKYIIDLASQAKKEEENDQVVVKLSRTDFMGEVGVGFDFYNEWFKFGVELKMSYGVFDLIERENNIYDIGIESLRAKMFQLTFTFE